jgi:hypothetical protein
MVDRNDPVATDWRLSFVRTKGSGVWLRPGQGVFSGPYRVIYHVMADDIDVVAVIHGFSNVLQGEQE